MILAIWISALIVSWFFMWVWGEGTGKKFWKGLLERDRAAWEKKRDFLTMKIAELSDGLAGKCEACKGMGVRGFDGESDCWDCGGTGLETFDNLRIKAQKNIQIAEKNTNEMLTLIATAKEKIKKNKI